jgi:hypothetical protein
MKGCPLAGLSMKRFASVDHAEERRQYRRAIAAIGPLDKPGEGSQRQYRRDCRHQYPVRRLEHAFSQEREARWAIEEYHVVVVTQRTEQAGDDAPRLFEATEQLIQLPIREVRRQQAQSSVR